MAKKIKALFCLVVFTAIGYLFYAAYLIAKSGIAYFADNKAALFVLLMCICLFGAAIIIFSVISSKNKKELEEKKKAAAFNTIEKYKKGEYDTLTIDGFVVDKDEQAYYPPLKVEYLNINGLKSDAGNLVITNKKVIFIGNKKTRSYEYKNIALKSIDDKNTVIQLQNKKDTTIYTYVFRDNHTLSPNRYDFIKWKALFDIFYEKGVGE